MRFLKTLILLLFLFSAFSKAEANIFNLETAKLKNGLEIVVIPNHRAPVVTHMIWYKIGAADELEGKSGIAHFLEHLMFKGTEKFPDGTFSSTIRKLGGNDNAFTAQDYTAYYQNIPKMHLEKVIEMEADRMRNLTLNEQDVLSERQVILEERSQRIDNIPQALFQEKMMNAIFPNHPYGISVIGWRAEMEQLSKKDAIKTYQQWYAPNNAILVISGDVTLNEVLPLAKKYYEPIEPSENISDIRVRPNIDYLDSNKRLYMYDNKIAQPILRRLYNAPRNSQALSAAAYILGGSSSSFLYKELVLNNKTAISVSVGYNPISLDNTTLIINAIPAPSIDLEMLEKDLDKALEKFTNSTISDEDLENAKKIMKADFIYYLDSLQGPAIYVGRHLTSGFTIDEIKNMEASIDNITITDTNNSIKQILAKQSHLTGILAPQPTGAKQ